MSTDDDREDDTSPTTRDTVMARVVTTALNDDPRIAVMLAIIGLVIGLTGLAFLMVGALVRGGVILAFGISLTRAGYRTTIDR